MIVKKVDVSVLPQIQTKVKLIKMNGVKPLLVVSTVLVPHSRLREEFFYFKKILS